ncbi:GNAT family N-acetyltransferase [Pseudodesulfovibrio sp.]|uniref:GNAT family N-acetyltransferase n=1 Tax=Pseudodesulfovibrio sp. TaxID=2035812 RepID=UPI002605F651|nr:GNAT family N-acetyltransferase [Pseudodesulfovibrio sp.]MDD3313363.1 GNAT family N-acetyltransferase [Pseudodesulfovibrio sp.]
MALEVKLDCSGVDWQAVVELLRSVGMGARPLDDHVQAFQASHTVVFVFDGGLLVGVGRAISDGVRQAAIYDCAVRTAYQGQGIGSLIIESILDRVAGCDVTLYAMPGKEGFYERFGFKGMKTAMAKFTREAAMREMGFTE